MFLVNKKAVIEHLPVNIILTCEISGYVIIYIFSNSIWQNILKDQLNLLL
jgi:hypothetical protein